ncbi:DUF6338 family protein [Rahnella perminowiae]|uniref:DUF6338 family protein n=1 Tax=Rahnella perminowiae TaxID=2816244 RepID=UPI00224AF96C|nr:DUF6338 family protein [Rahnella perminowiae]MCX2943253.1 DUF6338 family protein [Rahnella perminowiae]
MPTELASNLLLITNYLLPGFVAAWLFYGLTSHPKPSQFERVIQAFIFTFIIQVLMPITKASLLYIGNYFVIAPWTKASETFCSFMLSVAVGLVFAIMTNKDSCHTFLRKIGLSSRTSHPSEWFGVFNDKVKYVVLHLEGERRLYGWPKEWPVDADKGHFYIMQPSWLDDEGEETQLTQLDGILIDVKDVKWVEFVD